MAKWELNPRALGKALGALCNPRRPAAHGRSTPAISTINLKPRLHGGALSLYMDIKGVERER